MNCFFQIHLDFLQYKNHSEQNSEWFLFYQHQFFTAGHFLNFCLSFQCVAFVFIFFAVKQGDRGTAACIFCTFFLIVGFYSFFQVCCPACIQSAVSTLQNINIIHIITNCILSHNKKIIKLAGNWFNICKNCHYFCINYKNN